MAQQVLGDPQSSKSQQRRRGEQPAPGGGQAVTARLNQCEPCNECSSRAQLKKPTVTLAGGEGDW